jgi:hypothetical protein
MNTSVTMQEFHALLSSETEENVLLAALRKLMVIEKPEDVAALASAAASWVGWGG